MENWMRGLTKQLAMMYGIAAAIIGILIYGFVVRGLIGGGIMGGFMAVAFMLIHKGVTGDTLKEKQEKKNT